jgi:spermidine synthase
MMEGAISAAQERTRSREIFALVYSVFVAGLCSIVYELLIATTVSYFLGDSVKYFSITIGLYMAAMGIGAYCSKYAVANLIRKLVTAEIILGLLGGFSIPLLYLAYSHSNIFMPVYAGLTIGIGLLIGLEIPFLTRLLEKYDSLRVSIAHVLALDYLGAVFATVAFPLLLLPFLGIFKTGLIFGLINMSIGLLLVWCFAPELGARSRIVFRGLSVLIIGAIGLGFFFSNSILKVWSNDVYDGRILHTERTPYQQIVLSKYRDDLRLYLDGNLQFSSIDEYRYHEALIHPAMSTLVAEGRTKLSVLLLGGGDGLAVREVAKYPQVARVTLVDLDPAITNLARVNPHLLALNERSLLDNKRVRVINQDAFAFLRQRRTQFDLIVGDLPDPNNTDLSRLYTEEFYRLVKSNLSPGGLFVTQATSPVFANKAFWAIHRTVEKVFGRAHPYHLLIPSFGDWGFSMAANPPLVFSGKVTTFPIVTKFIDAQAFERMSIFERDLRPNPMPSVSSIDRPVILKYYLEGWRHWGR